MNKFLGLRTRLDVHPLGHIPVADTSQPVASLRAWGNNRRGQNCKLQLVAEAGKTISLDEYLMFVHRWRGCAKWLTSQGGGGGGGGCSDEPLEPPPPPPGSAPAADLLVRLQTFESCDNLCFIVSALMLIVVVKLTCGINFISSSLPCFHLIIQHIHNLYCVKGLLMGNTLSILKSTLTAGRKFLI